MQARGYHRLRACEIHVPGGLVITVPDPVGRGHLIGSKALVAEQ